MRRRCSESSKTRAIRCAPIAKGEALAQRHGFATVRCDSIGMAALVGIKSGFPSNQYQCCTAALKGMPFLVWIDEVDPDDKAIVLIGKRREESAARADTPEFIESSEHHGGRRVWHPLYRHSKTMRDALLKRAGVDVLSHRSRECSPCVNANRDDFLALTPGEIERVNDLEVELGKPMFRPKRFNAVGIHGVLAWARDGKNRGDIEREESTCADMFGCGM